MNTFEHYFVISHPISHLTFEDNTIGRNTRKRTHVTVTEPASSRRGGYQTLTSIENHVKPIQHILPKTNATQHIDSSKAINSTYQ